MTSRTSDNLHVSNDETVIERNPYMSPKMFFIDGKNPDFVDLHSALRLNNLAARLAITCERTYIAKAGMRQERLEARLYPVWKSPCRALDYTQVKTTGADTSIIDFIEPMYALA